MSRFRSNFNSNELLEILNQSKTATAIHTTDEMIIEMANDAMIAIWGKDRSVIGKPLEEALPELKGQPFLGMLQSVLFTGKTISGSTTRAELEVNGVLQPFYFDFEYKAVKNSEGEVICVLHSAVDVTDRYLSRQRELFLESELQASNEELASANEELAASNEELASTNEQLISINEELGQSQNSLLELNDDLSQSEAKFRGIVTQAPVGIAVLNGRDLILEAANAKILSFWGKPQSIVGLPLAVALPELKGQPFLKLLDDTFTSGEVYYGNEALSKLEHNGRITEGYFNFIYQPIKDGEGNVVSIMVVSSDVTEQVTARKKLQASEHRLQNMVMTAPIGMTVLRGHDLVVEIANQPIYELWHREEKEVLNRPLIEVLPELKDQPFPGLLQKVLETGERLTVPEFPAIIQTPEGLKEFIVSFSYDPLFDMDGKTEAILVTAMDITDQVTARDELQKARDVLKQAIDSAGMGTWSADLLSNSIILSEQGKKLHGVAADQSFGLDNVLQIIAPEHIEKVRQDILKAIESKKSFGVEYLVKPKDSAKPRWIRSTGKAYYDDKGQPISISGTMIDITETKVHDQRKDDFISIASHELKTPVTTLKAALQLLDKMKNNPSPVMLPKLVEQSNRSMEKISGLIEDLLNVRRMNEGQMSFDKSTFTLSTMLNGCCTHVRMAGKHNLVFDGDAALQVFADEHRVDQVVVNLVNNAVKYAPNSKDIFMIVERMGNMAKISIKDTGPGIEPEKLAHLFERYYRADAAGYQNSGLGLGLYISAEIIKRHGGEIGVDSKLGEGSTFWFTLPVQPDLS